MTNSICCKADCGVEFGLPDHVYRQARQLGKGRPFWCPNGHEQCYLESEADRLTKKLTEATQSLETSRAQTHRLEDEVSRVERTVSHWKGIVTRLKRGRR